jgi:glycosyltransferase involved in cell wall biosynthesis
MLMTRLRIAQVATIDMSIHVLLLDQIKALQQLGHEVVAFCSPGPFVEKVQAQGVTVQTVNMSRELSPMRDLLSLWRLYRSFRRGKFDVVHTHTPKAGLLGPLAARLAGIPMVVHTVHGLLFHDQMPAWKRWLFWIPEKITASLSHVLLSQSFEDVTVARSSRLCPAAKIHYLGNGIDIRLYSPQGFASTRERLRRAFGFRDTDFIVGSVGRLVHEKGYADLLEAAQRITLCRSDIKFLLVGPQERDKSDAVSAERITELADDGRIIFAGWRNDVAECYTAMDVFLLPSHREGVPRACMEAAAAELPVIATNIRGCREVVRHGETGLLVGVRDVSAIVEAVEALSRNRALAVSMGRRGRKHILENFEQLQVLERLCHFYEALDKLPHDGKSRGVDSIHFDLAGSRVKDGRKSSPEGTALPDTLIRSGSKQRAAMRDCLD